MKKPLKSIAKSMKVLAERQLRNNAMQTDSLKYSLETLQINRETQRILMDRVEVEQKPFASVLEGLLELVAVERITDAKSQRAVDEAKQMIRMMKVAQEK